MSMRTIWVAIRGLNYTDRATREVGRNIGELVKRQQELRQQATQLIMAGTMWVAMAGMATFAITKIMEASAEGRRAMLQLGQATDKLTEALGTAFAKVMGPAIQMLVTFLNAIANAPPWVHNLIAAAVLLGITFIALKGIIYVLGGALEMLKIQAFNMGMVTNRAIDGMTAAFTRLQASMGVVILGFSLGVMLASMFGENAWVLIPIIGALTVAVWALNKAVWHTAMGVSIATMGIAAMIGVAAVVAASMWTPPMPSYQTGTAYVRRTGPAYVHEGEQIIPSSDRWVGKRVATGGNASIGPQRRQTNVTMTIGTVQTKADKEELKPIILKVIKEALDNKV